MDGLTALLDGPRARRAFVLRALVDPPFGIRVADAAPLTLVAVLRGQVVVRADGSPASTVGAGGLVVARGTQEWVVADSADRRPSVVVLPGNVTATPDGDPLCHDLDLGTRAWGSRPDAEVALLVATYPSAGDLGAATLAALPPLVTLARPDWDDGLLDLLDAETARDAPGQDAVLDRLLDVVLVRGLRAWFTGPAAQPPGWYRGRRDPVVATALDRLHEDPSAPWTVGSLARAAGTSRATLVRRFTALVGRPPIGYLTDLRLALAADLLVTPGATVASVARQVGYATPYAFGTAFRRARGVPPGAYARGADR